MNLRERKSLSVFVFLCVALYAGISLAQVYSNIPSGCVKNGLMVCYELHPVISGKSYLMATNRAKVSGVEKNAIGDLGFQSSMPASGGNEVNSNKWERMKEKLKRDYPGDHFTQLSVLNLQKKSYIELTNYKNSAIDAAELEKIKQQVISSYPEDYFTQLSVLKLQVKSYLNLQ